MASFIYCDSFYKKRRGIECASFVSVFPGVFTFFHTGDRSVVAILARLVF